MTFAPVDKLGNSDLKFAGTSYQKEVQVIFLTMRIVVFI